MKRSKRSIKQDRARRSKEPWERGKKAPRKGNPRYKPVRKRRKDGTMTTTYVLRNKPKKKKRK